jgi:putative thioredoxin
MSDSYIIDVNEMNFEEEVMLYSMNTAVLLNFWAHWSKQSKEYKDFLESLTIRLDGMIRLASINIDLSPLLSVKFAIHKLPTLKLIFQEQIVGELIGPQPESRIIQLINAVQPADPTALEVEKAQALLTSGDYSEAEELFNAVLEKKSQDPEALLGYAKALLYQGKAVDALYALKDFPASKWYSSAEAIIPLAKALVQLRDNTLPDKTELDFSFRTALRFASENKYYLSIDGLMEILKQDRNYLNGFAHKVILAIIEMLPDEDPQKRMYRSELASILF